MRKYATAAFGIITLASSAAVPLRWTVETSRLQPAVFDVVRGETLQLEAAFNSYGKPIQMTNETACVFWQTNGMGNAWWVGSAVAWSNLVGTAFLPSMDPGAATVSGFLGSSGSIYRAAFTLRYRHGPGAFPNVIDMPPKVLDLAHTVVVNPPWPTQEDFAATTGVMRAELKAYVDDEIAGAGTVSPQGVTNIAESVTATVVTKEYVEGLGIEAGTDGETVTNIVDGIVASSNLCTVAAAQAMTSGKLDKESASWLEGPGFKYLELPGIHTSGFGAFEGTISVGKFDDFRDISRNVSLIDYISSESWTNGGAMAYTEAVVGPVETKADQALEYSSGVFQYMTGNTNAWFSGTNYVTNAGDATNRTHFAWEELMDAASVPCSMALWEIREGAKRCVWDQRDWTVWYWNFKSAQMSNALAAATAEVSENVRTNFMRRGWSKYTAVNGLDNPDPTTTFVDTPKVSLFAGHNWEKLVETGGSGYWTITGNGIELSAADATNTFLTVKDFEGNACITFRKTSSYLVYCSTGSDIVSNYMDNASRVVFHLATDVQPTAEFSTVLDTETFVEQGEEGCPANYEWTGTAGSWDCHFLLKPGIASSSCFARFKVEMQGENVVEHTVPIKLTGGIVFEQGGQTLKCRPVATGTSAGSAVNWVVAQ